jgi:hypothetical protein
MFKDWGVRSWIVFAALWFGVVGLTRMVYQPASGIGSIAVLALAACLSALLVYAFSVKAGKVQGEAPAAADSPGAATPAPVRSAWQKLGADPQAREESIRHLFDTRSGIVEFETQWDFDYAYQHDSGATEQAYSSMSFRLARPLMEMGNRESELLRAAYRLYNADLIDAQTWRDLTFCSVYGAGSASIISCEYREPVKLPFSDDAGAIKYYADAHQATAEKSERKLLAILERLALQPDALDVVLDSMRRLQ